MGGMRRRVLQVAASKCDTQAQYTARANAHNHISIQ